MSEEIYNQLLGNYSTLLQRIDTHTATVAQSLGEHMACKLGCDTCCRFLTLFPVEALSLSRAFEALSIENRIRVEKSIRAVEENTALQEACPLLIDHACMLYPARPVICRTHGFPIFMEADGEVRVDFCPKNFTGQTSFPKETLLDLEQLNTMLSAINTQFVSMLEGVLPERMKVSDALYFARMLGIAPEEDIEPGADMAPGPA